VDSLEHLGAAALDADGVGFGGQLAGLVGVPENPMVDGQIR
jgi:hypothetical protein